MNLTILVMKFGQLKQVGFSVAFQDGCYLQVEQRNVGLDKCQGNGQGFSLRLNFLVAMLVGMIAD